MCGRFLLTSSTDVISDTFGVETHANIPMRYNIAPTQPVLIVRQGEKGKRELASVEWGLVPEWAKELRREKPMINARVETVIEKASFRSPMKRTRCLVPADGCMLLLFLIHQKFQRLIGDVDAYFVAFLDNGNDAAFLGFR